MFILAGKLLLWLLSSIFIDKINFSTLAQPVNFLSYCGNAAHYTVNSTYQRNLDAALATLSTTNNGFGFYNRSVGLGSQRVNTVPICRGDVSSDVCRSCVNDSIVNLRRHCPNQKEAIGYYDHCLLRYSNVNILGNTEKKFNVNRFFNERAQVVSPSPSTPPTPLSLLPTLPLQLFLPPTSSLSFPPLFLPLPLPPPSPPTPPSSFDSPPSPFPTLPTPPPFPTPLTPVPQSPSSLGSPLPPPPLPLQAPPPQLPLQALTPQLHPPPPGKKKNTIRIVIIIVIVIVIVVIIFASVCIFVRLRKKKKQTDQLLPDSIKKSFRYNFSEVKAATNNFSEENKIGQGGFGSVYKGTLKDGHQVAVKRLAWNSKQGDQEFKNEVLLVAKLQHRNLVKLLGFSMEGIERLLIYEFLPNASLDQFIFHPTKRTLLDWEKRYNIIKGIAKELLYLHEDSRLRIIHRDMKASNVLLDAQMNAKIADFGMARLFNTDESQGDTSRIVGT